MKKKYRDLAVPPGIYGPSGAKGGFRIDSTSAHKGKGSGKQYGATTMERKQGDATV